MLRKVSSPGSAEEERWCGDRGRGPRGTAAVLTETEVSLLPNPGELAGAGIEVQEPRVGQTPWGDGRPMAVPLAPEAGVSVRLEARSSEVAAATSLPVLCLPWGLKCPCQHKFPDSQWMKPPGPFSGETL